jgi:hypothetical protein
MTLLTLLGQSVMATTLAIKPRPMRMPPDSELWRQIAASDVIAIGKLVSDPKVESSKVRWSCDLEVTETLKGRLETKKVAVPCGGDWEHEQYAYKLSGSKVIAFLELKRTLQGHASANEYLLKGSAEFPPVRSLDEKLLGSIQKEVNYEKGVLASFNKRKLEVIPEMDRRVAQLIKKLTSKGSTPHLNSELLKIDISAVPSLIARLDDRTPLTNQRIVTKDLLIRGPQVVSDLIAIALEELTHFRFYFLDNGGTEELRKREAECWYIYYSYLHSGRTQQVATYP